MGDDIMVTPDAETIGLAVELAGLMKPDWPAVRDRIPAWHPRNDGEDAPAGGEGTVAADTPEQGTGNEGQPSTDWQERYNHLQPEFTRATQDRDRYRQEAEQYQQLLSALSHEDAEIRQQAAQALNLTLAEEEAEDTQDGVLDPRMVSRLEALEQQIQARDQEAQDQAAYAEYRQTADAELGRMGVPKGLHDVIADTALGMAEQTGNAPDLQAALAQVEAMAPAWAEWSPVQNHVKKSWEQTKRAPHITQTGVPGQGAPDLDAMSRSERHEFMAQRLQDMES